MSKKIENQKAKGTSIEAIIAILIVLASLVGFYLDPLNLITTLYKVVALLIGLSFAGFIFFKSEEGIRFNSFLKETRIELRKVVWPNRDETIKTTAMIMVAVVIVAIFLWIVDAFFSYIVQLLTNQ